MSATTDSERSAAGDEGKQDKPKRPQRLPFGKSFGQRGKEKAG